MNAQDHQDIDITKKKWKQRYSGEPLDEYEISRVPLTVKISSGYAKRFLFSGKPLQGILLEAGCGTARTSLDLSLSGHLVVICADISIMALQKARELFRKNNPAARVYFICCDLRFLPFKDGSLGNIFSDGAIEHFKDTLLSVKEFLRVLKKEGRVFVTVPCLSFSMLTYGQLQGNIPDIFLLKNIMELIHIKALKSRLMVNGYELSFFPGKIKKLFKKAGFSKAETGYFDTFNEIRFLKSALLKGIFRKLARMRMFWPLIYIYAQKQ